ncbi:MULTISPECIES: PAS domain S-box protein [Kamptonema]|uniref:PAS domain S-box protein n=1 Tax=Kamptonema TaxID=1501433 RepID=UPI0001DAC790|nr:MULTISPECIES: PAS domain S-box protein [Kamptonema]CBN59136.1 Sensor protein [Kamptonema sp. PCC 6506]
MNRASRTILIVDESSGDRELYRRYLLRDREYDYTILEAGMGQQGLDLWQQQQLDAVLLNYRLPDLDGIDFLSKLQPSKQGLGLPVIVMTRQGNEAIAIQAMKAGAQDYLIKEQMTEEGLHLAVNRAIEAVQLRTQLQQRIDREHLVAQITQQISQSLDLDQILQTTVTEVREFLHADRVLVLRLEPDGNGKVIAESVREQWRSLLSSTIYDPCLAENYVRQNQTEPINYDSAFVKNHVKRYRQGDVTAISDIQDGSIEPCHFELLAQFQVKANLVVPILHDEQFWGLLIAHHCLAPRSWQPLEIELLKELTIQVGIALRQAELYQQAKHELAERQQVEAALRESEERLQLALKASRMGTWNWNLQTGKITWSDNLEALFGLEPGEFDGSFEMFVARLHPDDRDRVVGAVDRAISTGENYDIEFRIVYPNGTMRWTMSQGKVLYDQNGQPMEMTGIDLDITERKRSAAALYASEDRFRQLAENINAVFWIKEIPENQVSYVSPAYQHLWGLNPQELYKDQQVWVDRIYPEDREEVNRAFQEKAAAGKFDEEYRIVLADGNIRWVRDRCFPLHDETGEIYRFTGIAEDITDRKHSEQALRESEERFRTSVDNMLDCFGIYSAMRNEQGQIVDFRIEYVNNAAFLNNQMTGEEQIGRGLCELLPNHRESGLFDEYCQVVETGQSLVKDSLVYEDEYGQQRLVRAFDIRIAKLGDGFVATWRDITDRKQTEVELQEGRTQLQQQLAEIEAIYQNAPIGLAILDTDLRFVRINQRLAEINGYSVEAHLGCTIRELLPDLADAAEGILRPILETGEPLLNVEIRGETPARPGVPRIWLEHFLPLKHNDRIIGISTVCEEITERIQTELLLRESEERYRTLFESMNEGFCVIEMLFDERDRPIDYHLLEINPVFEQQTGLKQAQGKTVRQIVPNLENHWFEIYGDIALTGKPARFENGSQAMNRWFEVSAFRVGKPESRRVAILFKDISDRKQVEAALRQSEERYRCLAELIPQLVWTANAEGALLDVNQRWSNFTGLTLEQVHINGWEQVVHSEDLPALFQAWTEAVQQGSSYQAEGRMRRADGVYRWHLHQAIGQKNEQGQIVKWFGTATDIEAQKQLEVERDRLLQLEQTAREAAERANRIKDEFLAILSHELRSPLNPILGWTKLLQTRKFNEIKTAEALATIERNAKLQCQLIDDLLDVAKILRGKLSIDTTPVNLVFVIESAIDTVRTAAVSKSILLHPVLPNIGQVAGDSTRLQQIVWNLLSNAIKFTPNGGRVDIRIERVKDSAHIIVSDTGKGINPAFLPYIFESFRQEDVSITRKYGGLGLGLAIVRNLVEAHGGTISADSPGEGLGATFTVRLPLLNLAPESNQTNKLFEQEPDLTGIRVLTVDDDLDARELLTVILREYGSQVMSVSSAAEVFTALESFQPDILISDIGMPEIDGYTLLQLVRTLSPEKGGQIPAIALTAYAGEVDQQRALTVGFQRHITKPLEPNQLAQAVVTLMRAN